MGLSVPRQNGKNALVEMRELFGMVALGEKILHTAHQVKTARKAFLRLLTFFDNPRDYPELTNMVIEIRKTNGQEAIVLSNGGSIEFVARSKNSARGFTVDILVMDEAQDMNDDHLEALLPTTSAAPLGNRQLIWIGTPPSEEDHDDAAEVFLRQRSNSLEDNTSRRIWHEWAFPEGSDFSDPDVWAMANPASGWNVNPANGIRLGLEEIAEDYETMSEDGFARERGGMWGNVIANRTIPQESWDRCAATVLDDGGIMCLSVDVSPSRNQATLAAAYMIDGFPVLDVIANMEGPPEWAVPRIVKACKNFDVRSVVIDGNSPAASLIEPLRNKGIEVTKSSNQQMKAACGHYLDLVLLEQLRHLNQPILNASVAEVRKRPLDDAFAWKRNHPKADITPVVATTLALWGLTATDVVKPIKKSGRATFV